MIHERKGVSFQLLEAQPRKYYINGDQLQGLRIRIDRSDGTIELET